MGGTIEGSKNISGYTSCEDTPGHYVAPVYRTKQFTAFYWSGVTSPYNSTTATNMCGNNPSQFSFTTNKTLWLDASFNGINFDGSTLYNVFDSNVDGNPVWTGSGNHYYGLIESGSNVQFIVYISSSGQITEWYSSCVATTPTPTPTPTPTGTPTPTYNYYDVTRFDCPSCTNPTYSLVARNNTTGGTLTISHYYNNGDGYVYRIDGYNAGTSYTIDLDGSATQGTNCAGTCAI